MAAGADGLIVEVHPDPAAAMVPAIAKAQGAARKKGRALAFIASVCGTDEDPQGLEGQEGRRAR